MFNLDNKHKKQLLKHGEVVSNKLSHLVREGKVRRIVVTDKDNKRIFHFPVFFFVIIIILFPLLVGFALLIFLMSEFHAIVERQDRLLE